MKWTVLHSEYLHQEPWLTIRKDRCLMGNGAEVPAFYVNEYPDWVNVFGLTVEGKVVMVKQYRHGIEAICTELPGGVTEAGEDPLQAAMRETEEETGYHFNEYAYLGKVCANPSTTNNFTHMFLATGGVKKTVQTLDATEELEVVLCTIEELTQLVKENRIEQSLHVNGIMYALLQLGRLQFK